MLYKFTGPDTEVFPTILTADGTLVAQPGDVLDLVTDPDHPRLVPVSLSKEELDASAVLSAHVVAEVIAVAKDETPDPTPTPED